MKALGKIISGVFKRNNNSTFVGAVLLAALAKVFTEVLVGVIHIGRPRKKRKA